MDLKAGTTSLQHNAIRRLNNKKAIRVVPVVDDNALAAPVARLRRLAANPCPSLLRTTERAVV